eukprot:CAMPEP_0171461330 /NCGR_PEP_ID=MMETSP0945-20130129/5822_1 /TAXON_ID=109269 /ORGANISM="Vaucheria litorea, Strain CCMP2940" /LENGTH=537 /DNA_ID=CAMNT_0011987657 /DNA_START=36 /DNA_END=1646 /DNA_ORIENTATION=+
MTVAVGIDLGSTHCNVGIWHKGRPEIIANHHGLRATPTMIAITDNEILVGESALTQRPKNLKNTIYGFKWMVGVPHADLEPHVQDLLKNAPFVCSTDETGAAIVEVIQKGKTMKFTPDFFCRHLFEHLKLIAEQFSGEKVGKCVLSIPADFTETQKKALNDCAKSAGLKISCFIADPIAVCIAYGLDRTDSEISSSGRDEAHSKPKKNILVLDLGGGGIESTLIERNDGMLSIKDTERDASLGGEVFVQKLMDFCAKDFKRKTGMDVKESKKGLLKLQTECERVVKALSMTQHAEPYVEALMEGVDFKTRITRMRFEDLCFDLFEKMKKPMTKCLEKCGCTFEDVDMVLLSGGIAHMPKIQAIMKQTFPSKCLFGTGLFPDEAVAIGATIQASLLESSPHPFQKEKTLPASYVISPVSLGLRCLPEPVIDKDPDSSPREVVVIKQGAPLPAQVKFSLKLSLENGKQEEKSDKTIVLQVLCLNSESSSNILANLTFEKLKGGDLEFDVGYTLKSEGSLKVEARESTSKVIKSILVGPT